MTITSKASTPEYRVNWERIFEGPEGTYAARYRAPRLCSVDHTDESVREWFSFNGKLESRCQMCGALLSSEPDEAAA